jgi:ankyrin repeat protein
MAFGNGSNALILSSMFGRAEVVGELLVKGTDVSASTNDGVTALMFAAHAGQSGGVREMIAHGADVSARR